jgi:hypothetical protein
MPRSLADGKTKFTVLVAKPVNPLLPTITELNAGIQAAANILASDFTWGAADSDTVAERSLADKNNVNAYAASNYTAGITPFRYFDETTGAPDPTEDALFDAVKEKGTELWCYARRTGKDAGAAWAAADEIFREVSFAHAGPGGLPVHRGGRRSLTKTPDGACFSRGRAPSGTTCTTTP